MHIQLFYNVPNFKKKMSYKQLTLAFQNLFATVQEYLKEQLGDSFTEAASTGFQNFFKTFVENLEKEYTLIENELSEFSS